MAAVAAVMLSPAAAVAAVLSMPTDAGAPPGDTGIVPIQIDDATGILGTDLVLGYDPAVAIPLSVGLTPLSAGHLITANLNHAGMIRISLYGAFALSGGGVLLEIEFESVGPLGSETDLTFIGAEVNEGQIPVSTIDGHYFALGLPGEVTNLRVTHGPGAGFSTLTWDPAINAATYNIYRGDDPAQSNAVCAAAGLTTTTLTDDGTVPAIGQRFYFVVTSANARAESVAGFTTAGVPRELPVPCPP